MRSVDSVAFMEPEETSALKNQIDNLDGSFSEILLKLIDAKNMTDLEDYKRNEAV